MDRYERRAQLRAEDPHGHLSSNDLDRIVDVEELEARISNLPDHNDALIDMKAILSGLLALAK
jgi:hypothetical protein